MRLIILLWYSLLLLPHFVLATDSASPPLQFVRNDGQWDTEIKFRAAIPGGFVFIKEKSVHYVFYDTKAVSHIHKHEHTNPHARESAAIANPNQSDIIKAHGFEVAFANASAHPIIESLEPASNKRNFFLGNDPQLWVADVPAFGEIIYKNLYPGIDLRFFTQHQSLKYEFIVSPGANVNNIRLVYEGASQLYLQDGFLQIKTTVNTVTETAPYCYQVVDQEEQKVPGEFELKGNQVTFKFPDGYNKKQPLVIDPLLVFSTYSGSFTDNWGFTATNDIEGNLFSGGIEFGNRFPATRGAFQVRFSGETDVAILKFSSDGSRLLYATYLGGREAEVPHSMIVNANNELIVMGTTSSANFPVTANAFDRSLNGGNRIMPIDSIIFENGSDLFITKFNIEGRALVASTYLGGSGNDGINYLSSSITSYGDQFRGEVNLDTDGNIYLATVTTSTDFPVVNPFQLNLKGIQDAVICKFNPSLSNLIWSTYLGGDSIDAIYSIRIGQSGSVYVCGGTFSNNLPVTANVIKTDFGGTEDGFVAKFQNNSLAALSYIGTDSLDQAFLMDLDSDENVYLLGLTFGPYPITEGVYHNPNSGQFIHTLTNDFSQTVFSTVVGSGSQSPNLSPTAFMISECGLIYLSGWGGLINERSTINLPVTADAFRKTTNGDDFYLMILNAGASDLFFGTFFGSPLSNNHVDGGTSRFDKSGTIYHAACACRDKNTFPTTPNAWSRENNGNSDSEPETNDGCNNAAFKIDLGSIDADWEVVPICGQTTPVRFINKSANTGSNVEFTWIMGNGDTLRVAQPEDYIYSKFDTTYEVTFIAKFGTCEFTKTKNLRIDSLTLPEAKVIDNQNICFGESVALQASGGTRYSWTPARGLTDPQIPNPVASPRATTTYTVTVTNEEGCSDQKQVTVGVTKELIPDFDLLISSECGKPTTVRFVNNSRNGEGTIWIMGNGDTLTTNSPDTYEYTKAGTYEIVLKVFKGICEQSKKEVIEVENTELPPNVITPNGDEKNETFIVPNPGSKLEIYNRWGKPIYQNGSYYNDWGKDVPNGVYYYLITSPKGMLCKGWIHVLR